MAEEDADAAIAAYTQAVTADPGDHEAWYERGRCYWQKAQALAGFAVEADGVIAAKGPRGRALEQAISDVTRALAICERAEYFALRGACWLRLLCVELALVDGRRAAALGDRLAGAWVAEIERKSPP